MHLWNTLVSYTVFPLTSGGVDILLGSAQGLSEDEALYSLMSDLYGSVDFDDGELGVFEELGDTINEEDDSGSNSEAWVQGVLVDEDEEEVEGYGWFREWVPTPTSPSPPPPSPPRPRTPEPLGRGPITMRKLRQSLDEAAQKPKFFCCVCCRILFDDAGEVFYCTLSNAVADDITLDQIEWPCYQYNTRLARKNGQIVACKTHKVIDNKALDLVSTIQGQRNFEVYENKDTRKKEIMWLHGLLYRSQC